MTLKTGVPAVAGDLIQERPNGQRILQNQFQLVSCPAPLVSSECTTALHVDTLKSLHDFLSYTPLPNHSLDNS